MLQIRFGTSWPKQYYMKLFNDDPRDVCLSLALLLWVLKFHGQHHGVISNQRCKRFHFHSMFACDEATTKSTNKNVNLILSRSSVTYEKQKKIAPNNTSFVALLSICRHDRKFMKINSGTQTHITDRLAPDECCARLRTTAHRMCGVCRHDSDTMWVDYQCVRIHAQSKRNNYDWQTRLGIHDICRPNSRMPTELLSLETVMKNCIKAPLDYGYVQCQGVE